MESGFYRDLAPGGQSIKFGLIGHKQIWKFIGLSDIIENISN